jgi:hypothetical protein
MNVSNGKDKEHRGSVGKEILETKQRKIEDMKGRKENKKTGPGKDKGENVCTRMSVY